MNQIHHMHWSMGQREEIIDSILHPTSQVIMKRIVKTEIEVLKEKIHNERLFICKYKRNYRRLAKEAYGRIRYYRERIRELS